MSSLLTAIYDFWHSLSPAEKRKVRQLGKSRSAKSPNGPVQLMDLFQKRALGDGELLDSDPLLQSMGKGLPTQVGRLRQLILDALLLSGQNSSIRSYIMKGLREAQLLMERGQIESVRRSLPKLMRKAAYFGFFNLEAEAWGLWEQIPGQELRRDHQDWASRQAALLQVQSLKKELLDLLRTEMRPRDPEIIHRVADIAQAPILRELEQAGHELTRRIAVEVQGLCEIVQGEGPKALPRFEKLIQSWQDDPRWVREYPRLFLDQFRHYQLSVQFGTQNLQVVQGYRDRLPRKDLLPQPLRLEYDRIRFSHLFSIGLNTGQLEALYREVPQLLNWLEATRDRLPAGTQLALLYNASIAYFVGERWEDAYRILRRILEHPSRSARIDIRAFARILQLILLYERGDHDLNHYLSRSARSYFRRYPRQWQFELAVATFIGFCPPGTPAEESQRQIGQLSQVLEQLQVATEEKILLLGLNEVRWWLKAKRENKGLEEVYRELVSAQNGR